MHDPSGRKWSNAGKKGNRDMRRGKEIKNLEKKNT
jgi:hypothetical protein